jgi:hypothetical protein
MVTILAVPGAHPDPMKVICPIGAVFKFPLAFKSLYSYFKNIYIFVKST